MVSIGYVIRHKITGSFRYPHIMVYRTEKMALRYAKGATVEEVFVKLEQ